jgi:hypothetical protein
MRAAKLKWLSHTNRSGIVLIIMVLLIVVFCTLVWLDPMALMRGSGSDMPWNEESRLVRPDEEVQQPNQQQPKILDNLLITAEAVQNDKAGGKINLYILTDGRVKGGWGGEYKPRPGITLEVVEAQFKGNIDPSKIYSSENGKDPTKLYLIAKGRFLILETNSNTGIVRTVKGAIYVTGWLDHEYNAVGKIIITSDKKSYEAYSWQGKGKKSMMIPDFDSPSFKMLF